MNSRSSTRLSLLVAIFLLSNLLVGCQAIKATAVAAATEIAPQELPPTTTSVPTRTVAVFPSTWTPTPRVALLAPSRTPTPTATFNIPQTMSAKATADEGVVCKKHADSWEIKVTPSWKSGWCEIDSLGGYYYEYQMLYPSQWTAITFGDVYPSVAFNTAQNGVEVRLYQLYNYTIRKYEGTLEDAPLKASFCDENDKCTPVVSPQEKIAKQEVRNIGGKEVLVLDSQDGKYNVRRYFFFVPFKYARPASNRLFFVKLYTPEPVTGANYTDLEKLIGDLIVSIKHNF